MCGHNSRSLMNKTILGDDMKIQWDIILVGMAKIALVYATMSLHQQPDVAYSIRGYTGTGVCE